jgi:hypothetical protein
MTYGRFRTENAGISGKVKAVRRLQDPMAGFSRFDRKRENPAIETGYRIIASTFSLIPVMTILPRLFCQSRPFPGAGMSE